MNEVNAKDLIYALSNCQAAYKNRFIIFIIGPGFYIGYLRSSRFIRDGGGIGAAGIGNGNKKPVAVIQIRGRPGGIFKIIVRSR